MYLRNTLELNVIYSRHVQRPEGLSARGGGIYI